MPVEIDSEAEAASGVGFVVGFHLERYMAVAGYGGWDDEMPLSTCSD